MTEKMKEQIFKVEVSLARVFARIILAYPIRISYENWMYLHIIKGDWIE